MDTASSGSNTVNLLDVLAPAFVVEVVVLGALFVLYYLAVHTNFFKNDYIAARIFMAFSRVWVLVAGGFIVSFVMFMLSLVLEDTSATAMRDSSLTLFLVIGWACIVRGAWLFFRQNASSSKRRKKTKGRKKK